MSLDRNLIDGYRDEDWETRGSNYIEGAANFMNPPTGDFRLRPDSPAIDTAVTNEAPSWDYYGMARPLVSGIDIGAIEYNASAQDTDADGLMDGWEFQYFGNPTNAPPDSDPDGDGHDNLSEQTTGTNPTNPASVLRCLEFSRLVFPSPGNVIRWSSESNRVYDVKRSENLIADSWSPAIGDLPATPPVNVYTDIMGAANTRFYTISVNQ